HHRPGPEIPVLLRPDPPPAWSLDGADAVGVHRAGGRAGQAGAARLPTGHRARPGRGLPGPAGHGCLDVPDADVRLAMNGLVTPRRALISVVLAGCLAALVWALSLTRPGPVQPVYSDPAVHQLFPQPGDHVLRQERVGGTLTSPY